MQALTLLILATLLALTGCGPSQSRDGSQDLYRYHSERDGVTCWGRAGSGGIACLPDSQLHQQPAAGEKIPASTPAPRQHDEGFQL